MRFAFLSIRSPLAVRWVSLLVLGTPAVSQAANLKLKPETLAAWDEYVDGAKNRMKDRLRPEGHFLWIDEDAGRRQKVAAGEIIAGPIDKAHNPLGVPSGLIHDWIGASFVPNATIADVFAVVNDYQKYKQIYTPSVIDSKTLLRNDTEGKFKLLLRSKTHFVKTALDGEYASTDVKVDATHWYSFSETTNIQEIEHYGQSDEHKLPSGEGTGVIWKLFSVSRFEQRDGGVYVELEAIGLSREVPSGLHWLVDPIIRRVAKSSLVTSLEQTAGAVQNVVASGKSKMPEGTPSGRVRATTSRAVASPGPGVVDGRRQRVKQPD